MSVTRHCLLVIAALSPWCIRRYLLRQLCNASFGRGAYVGRSYIDTQRLVLGDNSRIGSLNCVRHIREVSLGANAGLGNLNWISGASHKTLPDTNGNYTSGRLIIHDGGAITNRHYLDLHADIVIGCMALVAGVRSTLLTHSIDFAANQQRVAGIWIGGFTFVGTNAVLLPGVQIPEKCVVGAGAVVVGVLGESGCLYGGVPARLVKKLSVESQQFFNRTDSFVE